MRFIGRQRFPEVRTPYPPGVALPVRIGKGYAVAQLMEKKCSLRPEPIDARAWTFQERILSTRLLSFATNAGVAQAYCEANSLEPDDYLAGLWRKTLLKDLLWCLNPLSYYLHDLSIDLRQVGSITDDPYIAPSWSWVSALYPVHWITNNLVETAEVISIRIELVQQDLRFGAVKSGTIRLRGRLHRSIDWSGDVTREYKYQSDSHTHERQILSLGFSDLEDEEIWLFEIGAFQDRRNHEKRPILEEDPFHEKEVPEEEHHCQDRSLYGDFAGLILLSTGKENEFIRVGLYKEAEDLGGTFYDDDSSCEWCALNKHRELTEVEVI
ncbi:heterokaryon incompatibility 6 OR allele [Fusarium circinatum]|uniref:Heterokaryon incompatibility 6 OR allele n=1 Tax=Fusarium circinatum TaxID=48490 RepID=A0A8H5T173_FUSCI|nr:heterokaryon incompatibility 6 OR allele [Fusarium circinatum]